MTLTRLVLHNYMIHRDKAADLDGNLIALTGEMGHGKSTFVGAIQFCLTGEHPPWNRADLLSWGAEEGAAKLYFNHDGLDCSVMRKLHTSEVVLKIGDDVISGARNVESAMLDRLGIDKDILKQNGFVQQYEIQAILFGEPAKKERAFQKLLGIGAANKIWTDLGAVIQKFTRTENFDASIESLRQMIKRIEEELAAVDGMIKTSSDALALMPPAEELGAEINRLMQIQSKAEILCEMKKTSAKLNADIEAGMARLASLDACERSAMAELGCSQAEMEAEIEKLRLEHVKAKAELDNMSKLTSGATADGSDCPLCGSRVEAGQISAHVKGEMDRLSEAELSARKLYAETAKAYAAIAEKISLISREKAIVQSSLAASAKTVESNKELEKGILNDFAGLGVSADGFDAAVLLEKTREKIGECGKIDVEMHSLNMQIATMKGDKNAKLAQLKQAKDMLDAKIAEKELRGPMAERIEFVTHVRDWFHVSNGPRAMSVNAINRMTKYVNEYLGELHSEIEVAPDNNGLSFTFSYVDGRQVSDPPPSASKLSGGQKIELALAFRLAIYRYFGQKMGIMVLDEPTAHLSPEGIRQFGKLLQSVSTLAKNMNLQILMPTHEVEILPYMDSEIHFD